MTKYREQLPQLDGSIFLTDGGIETTLIFHDGLDLPYFASFHLLRSEEGRAALRKYFATYASLAREEGTGLILESATWRSSPDWGVRLGYDAAALDEANRRAVYLLEEIRNEWETTATPIVISGNVGPRGDGYKPGLRMTVEEAEQYHAVQIGIFARSAADMVTGVTLNYPEEAIGIVRAANREGMPVAISLTVETDGKLPSGETLKEAIERIDSASPHPPVYYMINCAHPTHFQEALEDGAAWTRRIRGLRANASAMSHAELDEATELDDGNPSELGRQYRDLLTKLPDLNVLGGCCGTDHRHVAAMSRECRDVIDSRRPSVRTERFLGLEDSLHPAV